MNEIKIDKIIRSKRSTVSIQINEDNKLVVRAPYKLNENEIYKIVQKHKKWIEKKQKEIEERNKKYIPKKFINGEQFLYLGNYYPLIILNEQNQSLIFDNAFFFFI